MTKPDVSFVIIEYHCLEEVRNCINTIREKCTDISCEILVSSNSCYSHENRTRLLSEFFGVKWIFNKKNLGFSKAVNVGISNASGQAIVILNPDVILYKGSMLYLYKYLVTQSDVGIIGPKIIAKDGNLQDSCRKFMDPLDLFVRIVKRIIFRKDVLLDSQFNYNKIQTVDWVIGAFMIIKRDAIEKIGLLDESYFHYVSDMDWCKKFWNCGFKVVYYPDLVVKYKGDRKSILPLITRKFINKYSISHILSYLRFLRKRLVNLKNIY